MSDDLKPTENADKQASVGKGIAAAKPAAPKVEKPAIKKPESPAEGTSEKSKTDQPKKAVKVLYTKECPPDHVHATIEAQQELVMEAAKHMLAAGVIKVTTKKIKGSENVAHIVQFV